MSFSRPYSGGFFSLSKNNRYSFTYGTSYNPADLAVGYKGSKKRLTNLNKDLFDYKKLGKYKNDELYIKKGKYGIYAEWGSNKKSLNEMKKDIELMELEEVIDFIENNEGTGGKNCIRVIDKNLSIRNGKYGDYIFYKTEKMTKPQFYKLNGFKEDYKSCSVTLLKKWINDTYFSK